MSPLPRSPLPRSPLPSALRILVGIEIVGTFAIGALGLAVASIFTSPSDPPFVVAQGYLGIGFAFLAIPLAAVTVCAFVGRALYRRERRVIGSMIIALPLALLVFLAGAVRR